MNPGFVNNRERLHGKAQRDVSNGARPGLKRHRVEQWNRQSGKRWTRIHKLTDLCFKTP